MNNSYEVELRGCTPDPLMAYLKALGLFRLVSEQKDSSARTWWRNDSFFLRSALDHEGLVEFLLNGYRPTPIVSPWNGGSGFYPKDNAKAMEKIGEQDSPRFQLWNEVIAEGRKILIRSQMLQVAKKDLKRWILAQCRARFPDDALGWLDAAYVLTSGGVKYPPLLGTGGNDGRLEFSNNFMQSIVLALNLDQQRNGDTTTRSQLSAALFNEESPQLVRKRSTGFYSPSSVGGANASVGFNDEALTNPWEYVLMFEGALLFAGAAARRLSAQASSNAVYPFTADSSAAGYGTSVDSEYGESARAEFWAPLWDAPVNLRELEHLVSEGRAQLGRRQVSSGADFARAVAGLGTERGISQFQRYGLLERNGKAYLAAPLGRFHVPRDKDTALQANVLFDLNNWMATLRRHASAGLAVVLSRLENAIFEFCQHGRPEDLQSVLIAVGHAEHWLSKSHLSRDSDRNAGIRPLDSLSQSWVRHANDRSAAFRLARAMASILDESGREEKKVRIGAVRENMFPVDTGSRTAWKRDSNSFVWTAADPLDNMLAVLQRRCLEGRMQNWSYAPLSSAYSASLTDIVAFLNGDVEPQRVADLALPLSIVHYRYPINRGIDHAPSDLPAAYAVMKMTLLPKSTLFPKNFVCREFNAETDIWMEPRMLSMLRAGRVDDAYQVACRRLKASGLQPLSDEPGIANSSKFGRRLAAALLFPLDENAHCALAQRALRKPHRPETQNS